MPWSDLHSTTFPLGDNGLPRLQAAKWDETINAIGAWIADVSANGKKLTNLAELHGFGNFIKLCTNNLERVRIAPSGACLIGEFTDHSIGNLQVTMAHTNLPVIIMGTGFTGPDQYVGMGFMQAAGPTYLGQIRAVTDASAAFASSLAFFTNPGGGSGTAPTQKLRITGNQPIILHGPNHSLQVTDAHLWNNSFCFYWDESGGTPHVLKIRRRDSAGVLSTRTVTLT